MSREMDQLAKSSIPSQFQNDFKDCSSGSEEEIVQCCTFPARDRKERDNSTIIVFEKVPYTRERIEEESKTNLPLTRTESQIPSSPIQNQENNAQILQQIESVHNPMFLDSKSLEPFSLNINEGEGSRTKQMYKFKSDLVSRYSEELEEENKHLKELLRLKNNSADSSNHVISGKAVFPARNYSHEATAQSVPLFTSYDRCLSECLPPTYHAKANGTKANKKFGSSAGSEAWLKMRKISFEIERSA